MESSATQEYLWRRSQATTAVFCYFCAPQKHPQHQHQHQHKQQEHEQPLLSFDGYERLMAFLFPDNRVHTLLYTLRVMGAKPTHHPPLDTQHPPLDGQTAVLAGCVCAPALHALLEWVVCRWQSNMLAAVVAAVAAAVVVVVVVVAAAVMHARLMIFEMHGDLEAVWEGCWFFSQPSPKTQPIDSRRRSPPSARACAASSSFSSSSSSSSSSYQCLVVVGSRGHCHAAVDGAARTASSPPNHHDAHCGERPTVTSQLRGLVPRRGWGGAGGNATGAGSALRGVRRGAQLTGQGALGAWRGVSRVCVWWAPGRRESREGVRQ
jgi:hypothetical protein